MNGAERIEGKLKKEQQQQQQQQSKAMMSKKLDKIITNAIMLSIKITFCLLLLLFIIIISAAHMLHQATAQPIRTHPIQSKHIQLVMPSVAHRKSSAALVS